MLVLAFSTAILTVVLRLVHYFRPALFPWPVKSAVPLILIGIAFACLQFAAKRTRSQMALGFIVSTAFVLWGVEQFLTNVFIVSLIDDIVVFLFVFDLSVVIYGHLKPQNRPVGMELPLEAPDK